MGGMPDGGQTMTKTKAASQLELYTTNITKLAASKR